MVWTNRAAFDALRTAVTQKGLIEHLTTRERSMAGTVNGRTLSSEKRRRMRVGEAFSQVNSRDSRLGARWWWDVTSNFPVTRSG
ncbi:MAG: hypothetical protein Ct9H300mP13_8320 [Gammaproteobacteria bacterium]|nr:MAG: hypothetical protein Ct9H300mP13_8320 [Gammaproteobacteria bacterium]